MTTQTVQTTSRSTLIGASLLVAGTCIGGGMLALPVATATAGFIPSTVMMLASWLFMILSGLLFLEVALWMGQGAHLMTMAQRLLGWTGRSVCWLMFLFITYISLIAYITGAGSIVADVVMQLTGQTITHTSGMLLFVTLFGAVLYLGTRFLGNVNTILCCAMLGAYFLLVGSGTSSVRPSLLLRSEWKWALSGIPLLLTMFSIPGIVPSLVPYLKRNTQAIRWSIIGGTTLALLFYLIWQFIVLGSVPLEGPGGFIEAWRHGDSAIAPLRSVTHNSWLATFADYFAFFALLTSFLGIGLALFDFIRDGLKQRFSALLLTLLPPTIAAILYPQAFLIAMEMSGGIGDAILSGIIPVCMVWVGRYRLHLKSDYTVAGGKGTLAFMLAYACVAFGVEMFNLYVRVRS